VAFRWKMRKVGGVTVHREHGDDLLWSDGG